MIARRLQTQAIGFKATEIEELKEGNNLLEYVSQADIRTFGLIPEIIGRLPVLCHLNPLDKAALKSILHEPKNALIKQYQYLFALEGIELEIKEEVIDVIVDTAFDLKLGARGLRSICEALMMDYMYDAPERKPGDNILIIDAKGAEEKMKVIRFKNHTAA
jgi:ATP-dependent Clp protease ATP-binding subunit ClpX